MLELDSLVDGVAAVAYGTPESAAATRCASETASGVLLGGGLGGGVGAGVSFWLVGEQEQNMVLGVLGEWGQRRRAATVMGPVMGQKLFRPCAARTASGAASGGRKVGSSFELLVSYRTLAGPAAPNSSFFPLAQRSASEYSKGDPL